MPDRPALQPALQLKLANSTTFSKTVLLTVSKIVYTHHASLTVSKSQTQHYEAVSQPHPGLFLCFLAAV